MNFFLFFKLFSGIILLCATYVGINRVQIRSATGLNGFGYSTTTEQVLYGLSLEDLTILVTGGNSGLGLETVRTLANHGASVILVSRSLHKAQSAIDLLRAEVPNRTLLLTPLACDLSSLASIEQAGRDFEALNLNLNVLINNAGIMALPDRKLTTDGFEKQIGVNHLGHFHLTNLLMPYLVKAASKRMPSRIVCLSSSAHRMMDPAFVDSPVLESKKYLPFSAYGNSKMANILHAQELNDRFAKKNVFAVSVHPGGIMTNLGNNMNLFKALLENPLILSHMPYLKSIPEGTSTQVYAAVSAPMPMTAGKFFVDCNVSPLDTSITRVFFDDVSKRKKLWATSEQLVQLALSKIGAPNLSG